MSDLRNVVRVLLRMYVTAHVETLAMEMVLHNLLPDQELQKARTKLLAEIEPLMQQFDQAPDDKLLEILQRFEGPVQ